MPGSSRGSTTARLRHIYGAAARGEALCCDATLVSPVRRDGSPHAGAPERDGVAIATAQRRKLARYPELTRGGPRRLCVLAAEVGGRWDDESQRLVQHLVALRARRAPATLRTAASGIGEALVGCLGGCGPANKMQRRPRSLDNASVARIRKRRAASRGPPVRS